VVETSSTGSLVRITPAKGAKRQSLKVNDLMIITPSGEEIMAANAVSFKASSRDLQATPFPDGTSVFKLDKKLGAGQFKVKSANRLERDKQFIVTVLEKSSPYQLRLQTGSRQIFAGQNFSAKIRLNNLNQLTKSISKRSHLDSVKLSKASGHFLSPDGRQFPVKLSQLSSGEFKLDSKMNLPMTAAQGLWELQVSSSAQHGQLRIKRNARIAFAYSPVTALVEKVLKPKVTAQGRIESKVNVRVEYAGRYEVMGVIYAQKNGLSVPIMESRTAMWLEVGNNQIPLLFDKLAEGASSYHVKDIILTDQSRMSVFPQTALLSPPLVERVGIEPRVLLNSSERLNKLREF